MWRVRRRFTVQEYVLGGPLKEEKSSQEVRYEKPKGVEALEWHLLRVYYDEGGVCVICLVMGFLLILASANLGNDKLGREGSGIDVPVE